MNNLEGILYISLSIRWGFFLYLIQNILGHWAVAVSSHSNVNGRFLNFIIFYYYTTHKNAQLFCVAARIQFHCQVLLCLVCHLPS